MKIFLKTIFGGLLAAVLSLTAAKSPASAQEARELQIKQHEIQSKSPQTSKKKNGSWAYGTRK